MREIEIYKEVLSVIAEENDRRVNIEQHDGEFYILSLAQVFSIDTRMKPWALWKECGFDNLKETTVGFVTGSIVWHHQTVPFLIEAALVTATSASLEIKWRFDMDTAVNCKDNVRAMNRIFNMFKSKLEAE